MSSQGALPIRAAVPPALQGSQPGNHVRQQAAPPLDFTILRMLGTPTTVIRSSVLRVVPPAAAAAWTYRKPVLHRLHVHRMPASCSSSGVHPFNVATISIL